VKRISSIRRWISADFGPLLGLQILGLFLLTSVNIWSIGSQVSDFNQRFEAFKARVSKPLRFSAEVSSVDRAKVLAVLARSDASPQAKVEFERWLESLPEFSPVFRVLEFYSGPESQAGFNQRNQKNSRAVGSQGNLKRQHEFYSQNKRMLDALEAHYRVNASLLVALCCTESRLSQAVLPYEAFAVFCTQILLLDEGFSLNPANSNKRLKRLRRLAMHNLVALYRYCSRNGVAVTAVRSSWAGACGPLQFMPFNFHYLADADGDGQVNIATMSDSMAGAARFLQAKGWAAKHWLAFNQRELKSEIHKLLLKYNANDHYARGVLQNAWKLQTLITKADKRSKSPFY